MKKKKKKTLLLFYIIYYLGPPPHGPHGMPPGSSHSTGSPMPFGMRPHPAGHYGGPRGMSIMDPNHPMNSIGTGGGGGGSAQNMMDYPHDAAKMMKLTKLGVEPKKRGRKSKAELQAIEQSKVMMSMPGGPPPHPTQHQHQQPPSVHPQSSSQMHHSLMGNSLIAAQQGSLIAPSGPGLVGPPGGSLINSPSTTDSNIPTTVLSVQNSRLMDPSELGPPGSSADTSPIKKRGRRKKFTPLRETLRAVGGVELASTSASSSSSLVPPISTSSPNDTNTGGIGIDSKTNSILSERLTVGK